jgi:NAD(P)-dependent dehydrogenase (short-subunit alcohol dehydrogenase family)
MESYCCCAPLAPCLYAGCTFAHGFGEALCPLPTSTFCSAIHGRYCFQLNPKEIFIVTGGNRGVGYYIAKTLLQRGHNVCILNRDEKNGESARDKLIKHTGNPNCSYYVMDLNDLGTIQKFLRYVDENDLIVRGLVNNAGMIGKLSMNANHVGHFALTIGLLESLRKAVKIYGRVYVVNVASIAHMDGAMHLSDDLDNLVKNSPGLEWQEYAGSKAANVLFGLSFHRSHQLQMGSEFEANEGISLLSYHPGVMLTDLWRTGASPSNESANEFARICLCCCVKHPLVAAVGLSSLVDPRSCFHVVDYMPSFVRTCCFGSSSGSYFQQSCCCCVIPARSNPILLNKQLQDKLWMKSMEYISQKNMDLYQVLARESITTVSTNVESSRCVPFISSNYPCSELLSAAPYCVCLSILC